MVGPATPVGALDYLAAKLEQLSTTPPDALPEAVLNPVLPAAEEPAPDGAPRTTPGPILHA